MAKRDLGWNYRQITFRIKKLHRKRSRPIHFIQNSWANVWFFMWLNWEFGFKDPKSKLKFSSYKG